MLVNFIVICKNMSIILVILVFKLNENEESGHCNS